MDLAGAGIVHRWPFFVFLSCGLLAPALLPQAARGGLHGSESVIPAGAMSVRILENGIGEEAARWSAPGLRVLLAALGPGYRVAAVLASVAGRHGLHRE
ncbi:hypothetical protein [Herbaspirillum sp. SJZ099]|uniref:hypothetical protein n=1 Tax=Herbaspirillum sp. SJZ099 TaxID=2572916 RepID=UPI0011A71E5F|nr:hypothetical protein [Herbaspirillum sp. SJZ099]